MVLLRTGLKHRSAKSVLWCVSLLPFLTLVWGVIQDSLGANPAEYLIRASGDWTLRFVCITLAVTPLRVMLAWPELARFRRMLGLYAFFYGMLHLLCYSWLDMGFDLLDITQDIAKRPFILVGFAAFVLLTPLALTSFNRAIRWLGAPRWQQLHKAVYLIACLAVLHFFWMRASKHNFNEVAIYAAIVLFLLGWRFWRWWRLRSVRP